MAIRRCPYCKAIIDEGSEFCSNCGTQLIFPEDEFVDEEIPGEKIIDVNEEGAEPQEEQNPTKEKSRSTIGTRARKKAAEVTEKEEEIATTDEAGKDEDEAVEAESKVIKPQTEPVPKSDAELGPDSEMKPDLKAKPDEEEIAKEPKEELPAYMQEASSSEPPSEELFEPEEEQSQKLKEETEEKSEEATAQDESADFRTEDLEGMVDPAEKEKEEIEKFLNSLKEEREKTKKYYEETGELPPWAQSMREGTASEAPFEEEESFGEEPIESDGAKEVHDSEEAVAFEESFEEEKIEEPVEAQESFDPEKGIPFEEKVGKEEEIVHAPDTGMGLPEGVDQQNLPFSKGIFESTSPREKRRRSKKPDIPFLPWVKSRIFDVLIIVGIWLLGLWLASRVVGIGFFQLLTTSTVQTLLFLVVLFIVYFFLFLFFLGETLGDHLFSEES